jgi:predicted GIY-YIG superfamily endonuclease
MYVYQITNKLNGKIYVGQTKFSVEKRFKQHAKANSVIGCAIRKYGIENFTEKVP